MKKTILVLVMVALCAAVFASVRVGANVMFGSSLKTMSSLTKEMQYATLQKEALKNCEVTAKLSVDIVGLDFGLEGGAVLQEGKTIPVIRGYGCIKASILGLIEVGGGAGGRLVFTENGNYEKELYFRFSGGIKLDSLVLEGVATLPLDPKDIKSSFDFKANADSIRLGVGLGIKIQ
jgi:hypothetical protein